MNRIFKISILSLATMTVHPALAESTIRQLPTSNYEESYNNIYDEEYKSVDVNIDLLSQPQVGDTRSAQVSSPNSEPISVTLNNVVLPQGSWLEVTDPSGELYDIYNDSSLYDGSGAQITTDVSPSGVLIISLVSPDTSETTGKVVIGQYNYLEENQSRAIQGTSQMYPVACFKETEPEFFARSHAVSHITTNGLGTGWNISGGPYVVTNIHVAGGVGNKNHTLKYNYEKPNCDDTGSITSLKIQSESVVLAGGTSQADYNDYAVYKVDELAYEEAGIRQIFGTLTLQPKRAAKNTPVYIPQHPRGNPKKMADTRDDGKACNLRADNISNIETYNCDTQSGSSGSPVLNQNNNQVVALHFSGTSNYNEGISSPYLYSKIKSLLPDSNVADTATIGEGKLRSKSINGVPFIPLSPYTLTGEEPLKITPLYSDRLRDEGNKSIFKGKGRVSGGDIKDININFSVTTPCGVTNLTDAEKCTIQGTRYLNTSFDNSDNPDLKTMKGWVTLQTANAQGERIENLIFPFTYNHYEPFVSPFENVEEVNEYTLTEKEPLVTQEFKHTSNLGFIAYYEGQGPKGTTQSGTGDPDTLMKVQVKNNIDDQVYVMTLRGNRKISCKSAPLRPMNSTSSCSGTKPAAMMLRYEAEDNEQLPEGIYTGILPIEAKRDNTLIASLLVHIDITK
ncbi:trypsin-like serine peptidase [Vagococcus sp. WN89Y]|uniref:trypsin-like serine peptidase n=1 Tax=Vagococcus sp. WN89Y TaxID=3457258 RepID=UPI003FCDBE59